MTPNSDGAASTLYGNLYLLVDLRGKFVNQEIIDTKNASAHEIAETKAKTKTFKVISREKETVKIVDDSTDARKKRRVQKAMAMKMGLEFSPVPLKELPSAVKEPQADAGRVIKTVAEEDEYTESYEVSEEGDLQRAPLLKNDLL
jgi:hypothetical protein